jgi:hypothetical protein
MGMLSKQIYVIKPDPRPGPEHPCKTRTLVKFDVGWGGGGGCGKKNIWWRGKNIIFNICDTHVAYMFVLIKCRWNIIWNTKGIWITKD